MITEKTGTTEVNGVTFCKRCLMPNTRPWGVFENGLCGACNFDNHKKTIDWKVREHSLNAILDNVKKLKGRYDVLVPVSGGKDGSHVAYTLKNKYGLRVLTATLSAPIWSSIGIENLQRFSRFTGIPNILVSPPYAEYRAINYKGLTEMGYPKRGFVAGLVPMMMRVADAYDCPLIMWGEHEEEYEGYRDDAHNDNLLLEYNDFLVADDFCGTDPDEFLEDIPGDTSMWTYPHDIEVMQAYWSRFEPWNSAEHKETAVNHCGLKIPDVKSSGTYSVGAQIDDLSYTFFMYMAFVKFGFGRVANDVGIDCRQNGMHKVDALYLLERYESHLPDEDFTRMKWYFDISGKQLLEDINQHWNKKIFDQDARNWLKQYTWKPEYKQLRREIAYA